MTEFLLTGRIGKVPVTRLIAVALSLVALVFVYWIAERTTHDTTLTMAVIGVIGAAVGYLLRPVFRKRGE